MENFAVLTEDGAFAFVLVPTPGDLTREFAIQGKKKC